MINKSTLLQDATAVLYGLGTDAVPDDVLTKIFNLIDTLETNNAKITTGSYEGTGTYGASNPNVINTEFPPQFLLLYQSPLNWTRSDSPPTMYAVYSEISVITVTRYTTSSASNGTIPLRITWGETSVSWYLDGTSYYGKQQQFNTGTWYYLVLG